MFLITKTAKFQRKNDLQQWRLFSIKIILLASFLQLTILTSAAAFTTSASSDKKLVTSVVDISATSCSEKSDELNDENEGETKCFSTTNNKLNKSDISVAHDDKDADESDNYEERRKEERWEHNEKVENNSNATNDNIQDRNSDISCRDDDEECLQYDLQGGECERNPDYMRIYCRKSCGLCGSNHNVQNQKDDVLLPDYTIEDDNDADGYGNYEEREREDEEIENNSNVICQDDDEECPEYDLQGGECEQNQDYMLINCRKSCGLCENNHNIKDQSDDGLVSDTTGDNRNINSKRNDKSFHGKICLDTDEQCPNYNLVKECVDNLGYTKLYCRKSCGFCTIQNNDDEVCVDGNGCNKSMNVDTDSSQAGTISTADSGVCQDIDDDCSLYDQAMICKEATHLKYAWSYCKETCGFCDDNNEYFTGGEHYDIDTPFGMKQIVRGGENDDILREYIDSMQIYMRQVVSDPEYDDIRDACTNQNPLCADLALQGACTSNMNFMGI